MGIDRLTERAKYVISNLPKARRTDVGSVMDPILKSAGMGRKLFDSVPKISIDQNKTVVVEELLKEAYYQALKFEHTYVGTEHLLLALLKLTNSPDLERVKIELIRSSLFPSSIKLPEKSKNTPLLDSFTQNLNRKIIRELDKELIPREEYEEMLSALLLKSSSNVLLVGDPGVGKKTLVELLSRNIVTFNIPPSLIGFQVIEFDLMSFITSLISKGGLEYGLANFVDEIKGIGRVILSVKNFQSVFISSPIGMTMPVFYAMFKSAMDSAGIPMIATVNTSLYEKISTENDHLIEGFSVVEISEPSEKEILKILEINARHLEEFHNVQIPKDVIRAVYDRAKGVTGDVKFPQKGIDLLDQACTHLVLKRSKIPESYKKLMDQSFDLLSKIDDMVDGGQYEKALITRKKLRAIEGRLIKKEESIFDTKTVGLTEKDIQNTLENINEESKYKYSGENVNLTKLASLSDRIKKRIIGQDKAVDAVTKSLIRSKLGLRPKKRPLGNFLLLGPTGVGKTEFGKVLADEFFGEKSLIRLDMSDFTEKHNVARLVGAPPGYVGYGEGGELTSKIEHKPGSVVLFDEIEKAHPDVLNILLQIMEEGELSDARGSTFDFSKSVVILTSNLGTELLHNLDIGFKESEKTDDKVDKRLKLNLKKIMKPELLNRFDDTIVFNQLKVIDQKRILNLLIGEIKDNLKLQNLELSVSADVSGFLLDKGYSKEYGARGLRRTLEKELLDVIAEYLLTNKNRPLILVAQLKNGKIVITGKKGRTLSVGKETVSATKIKKKKPRGKTGKAIKPDKDPKRKRGRPRKNK